MTHTPLKDRVSIIQAAGIPRAVREKIYPLIGIKLEDKRQVIFLMKGGALLKKFNDWMREVNPAWRDLV